MTRSGSPASTSLPAGLGLFGGSELGMAVVALISVLMRLEVMSLGYILCACAISASVRVKSTNVSLPSVAERRSRSRCGRPSAPPPDRGRIWGEDVLDGLVDG